MMLMRSRWDEQPGYNHRLSCTSRSKSATESNLIFNKYIYNSVAKSQIFLIMIWYGVISKYNSKSLLAEETMKRKMSWYFVSSAMCVLMVYRTRHNLWRCESETNNQNKLPFKNMSWHKIRNCLISLFLLKSIRSQTAGFVEATVSFKVCLMSILLNSVGGLKEHNRKQSAGQTCNAKSDGKQRLLDDRIRLRITS